MGAAFLKGLYSLYLFEEQSKLLHPHLLIVILVATVISYYALCFVGKMVQQKKMHYFAWYVLALAAVAGYFGK